MATKKRSSTASDKKPSTRRTQPRSSKRSTAADELVVDPEAVEPADIPELPVVTMVPEPAFAARLAPPPPPRARPEQRRGIFFDVENTSRAQDIEWVLRQLMIDRVGIDTDFTAVGNWRVIGHETARLLARSGANLVHSAPSTGVRDWSDLRIAVAAGVWLAGARPGDMIDIVSDDQAFDAVGDVASSLGVTYRRLSYRALKGHAAEEREVAASDDGRGSRRRRRGRGRRGGTDRRHADTGHHVPAVHRAAPSPAPAPADESAHTAPHDELIEVVADLMVGSPGGVTLDQLANALRERGFRRTPGSPRLITRLKRIKQLDVSRNGLIRLVGDHHPRAEHHGRVAEHAPAAHGEEPIEAEADEAGGEPAGEAASVESAPRRRRRRRGGRRRRGRRGGGGGLGGNGDAGGEVVAAAAPPTSEVV